MPGLFVRDISSLQWIRRFIKIPFIQSLHRISITALILFFPSIWGQFKFTSLFPIPKLIPCIVLRRWVYTVQPVIPARERRDRCQSIHLDLHHEARSWTYIVHPQLAPMSNRSMQPNPDWLETSSKWNGHRSASIPRPAWPPSLPSRPFLKSCRRTHPALPDLLAWPPAPSSLLCRCATHWLCRLDAQLTHLISPFLIVRSSSLTS